MRYEVPQFIDIQDKIFGPLTFKQFIYIAGAGGLSYALYKLVPLFIAIPLILILIVMAWALAFYKLNNQPFIDIGQAFFRYITKSRLYVWKKEVPKPIKVVERKIEKPKEVVHEISARDIQDLARNLDILDKTRYN